MSPFYPPEQIDLISSYNDIVEIISQYLPLKRSGRNYKALCPFHSEKTPSFMVSPEKQIYHCFGCGAGGNVFSFIMRKENMTFPEAVRFLARRANIELPEFDSRIASKKEQLLKLHELAAGFFHWGLTDSKSGESARRYIEKREITGPTIEKFKLGYAQPAWDSFLKHARKKGYKPETLLEAGLILKRSRGDGYYDRFRNRLIVPVCDGRGRIIAFGGRVLDDSQPKYINSPDTPLFRKGNTLFGLHRSRDAIMASGTAILGEGYFDVIRAHQEKVENMICSQGTAFTEIQAQVLRRYTGKVVVAYDSDRAGMEAALRGLTVFLRKNFEVRIVTLPPGEDPDSFIRGAGAEAFKKLVIGSMPLLDFKLNQLCRVNDIATDQGKLAVVREMLDTISIIESAVLRETYEKKLAERLGVSPGAVREEYGKIKRPVNPPRTAQPSTPRKVNKYEVRLLKYLMENDTVLSFVQDELDPEAFSPPLQPIVTLMLELFRQGKTPLSRTLVTVLQDKKSQELVSRWLMEPQSPAPQISEVADLLINIQKKRLRAKINECRKSVGRRGIAGKEAAAFLGKSIELTRELKELPARIRMKIRL
ncbi:MAG: DNA primase [Candidatus Euphemobacter frigidus]|nr:DNA primase [Candidatus Euphemobacter frigidus]MDP8276103.1 DNA primase [Candidatus Euphemobacter frigidus]